MFLAFRICARLISSKKGKDIFLWCSALQVFGQCGGTSIRTRFCENNFLGKGFRKTPTDSFLKFCGDSDFVRAGEGCGENPARASFRIFFAAGNYPKTLEISSLDQPEVKSS